MSEKLKNKNKFASVNLMLYIALSINQLKIIMAKKSIKFRAGLSESAWKSLVVKSLRIGWVQGLERAAEVLPKSIIDGLLICGIFEDLFPSGYEEMNTILYYIKEKHYLKLCEFETHHGRGYADQFCDMEKEAVRNGRARFQELRTELMKNVNLYWVNPRIANCLYTWLKIAPQDVGVRRSAFKMEWNGMPLAILDGHTYEGKQMKHEITLLSGHYENHRKIGRIVMSEGWDVLRENLKKDDTIMDERQKKMF